MNPGKEEQKWPFDPMQPGDHEPVRIPDDHPSKDQKHPDKPELRQD